MADRNIEIFNRVVAVTLVKLYESFPNPIPLAAADIGHEAGEGFTEDIVEQMQLVMETAGNTITFLAEEGFLRFDPNSRCLSGPEFPDTRLTLNGFTLLGKVPEGVDQTIDRRSFVDQLRDVAEEGSKATASKVVQSLFTGAIRLGATAVGMA